MDVYLGVLVKIFLEVGLSVMTIARRIHIPDSKLVVGRGVWYSHRLKVCSKILVARRTFFHVVPPQTSKLNI